MFDNIMLIVSSVLMVLGLWFYRRAALESGPGFVRTSIYLAVAWESGSTQVIGAERCGPRGSRCGAIATTK